MSAQDPWWATGQNCEYAIFTDESGNEKAWVTNGTLVVFGKVDAFMRGNPQERTPKKRPLLQEKLNKGYVQYSMGRFLTHINWITQVEASKASEEPVVLKQSNKVWQPPSKAKAFGGLNF